MDVKYLAAKAVANRGNVRRMKEKMRAAEAGKRITLGFIGGSITQGSLASRPESCYAELVTDWWRQRFANAKIQSINAGVGGTTSHFGTARVQRDLLHDKPDVIVAEFSVNDENNGFYQETYEGLVRQILACEWEPALLLLFNVCYDSGKSAEEVHLQIGKHYDLPCLSIRSSLYRALREVGEDYTRYAPDGLHPNDLGHGWIADIICCCLDEWNAKEQDDGVAGTNGSPGIGSLSGNRSEPLPEPLTANRFQKALLYNRLNGSYEADGFTEDLQVKNSIQDIFSEGFYACREGAYLEFTAEGTHIAVQYRKSVAKSLAVKVWLDGEEAGILDGNFDEDWGDCLYLQTIYLGDKAQQHHIRIETMECREEAEKPFYLSGFVVS